MLLLTSTSIFQKTLNNFRRILMKTWQCIVCGFIYDEALGLEEDGIPAGTLWENVPNHWSCPDCGVSKADFEMIVI
jgi:rubredoxin